MTDMTTYDSYLYDVLSEVDGCPPIIAETEIRNTMIDFCKVTLAWKAEVDPISVIAGTAKYELDVAEGIPSLLTWGYMLDASGEEIRMTATSEDELDADRQIHRWRNIDGTPSVYFMTADGFVHIVAKPTEPYTLYLGAALIPSRESYEAPTFIYNKFMETITAGARARLLNMKAQSWYNAAAAKDEEDKYEKGKLDAKVEISRSHTRTKKSVVMRPLA